MTHQKLMGSENLDGKPSCCKEVDSFDNFAPQVTSSWTDKEALNSSESNEDFGNNTHRDEEIFSRTIKTTPRIISKISTEQPEVKLPACCRNKAHPSIIQREILDETVNILPRSTRGRETFPSSKSFANSISQKYYLSRADAYNVTDPYTNYGRISTRQTNPYNVIYYPRTHVPRASRNYRTYDNLQPNYFQTPTSMYHQRGEVLDRTRGQNMSSMSGYTYGNLRPTYFSTPVSKTHRGDVLLDRSLDSKWTTPRARPDTFVVTNEPTSPSRYGRKVPTVDRLYANPNLMRQPNPDVQRNDTYNYTQNSYGSPYKQMRIKRSSLQPETANGTGSNPFEESAYAQLADPEMPESSFERPQSAQMESSIQRRLPQSNVSYERPRSADMSGQRQLPACCRTGNQRPRTADPSSKPLYSDVNQLPACCRKGDNRTKAVNPTFKPSGCVDNTCGKRTQSKRKGDSCNDTTCDEIRFVSDKTQTIQAQTNVGCQSGTTESLAGFDHTDVEGPLDTLLEIRTPHKVTGSTQGLPFVLSINVSCADKSVVVTPDKGYKSISSYQP